jgi:hypothetical protein
MESVPRVQVFSLLKFLELRRQFMNEGYNPEKNEGSAQEILRCSWCGKYKELRGWRSRPVHYFSEWHISSGVCPACRNHHILDRRSTKSEVDFPERRLAVYPYHRSKQVFYPTESFGLSEDFGL